LPSIGATFAPVRIRPFGRLLTSYAVNYLGDYVALVALAVLVYDETGDALATTALFIATQFLPAFFAPALTAKVDQMALRRVLPSIYLLEGLIFLALAVLAERFSLPVVLALALLDGVLMLSVRGLTRSAVSAVLQPSGLLREGNSLINVAFAAGNVGGAALGGALVGAYGVVTALSVNAASFAVIALLLSTTSALPEPEVVEREPFRQRIREGIEYARRQPLVRMLLGGEAIAIVLFTLIVPIEVIYAKETLGTDDAGFGALLAAWGAGVMLGSLVFIVARRRRPLVLILLSTALIGVAYLGMSVADTLLAACALSVVGGLGNGIQWVSVMTAIQETTPPDLQARTTGLLESIASAATGTGFLLGGIVTALASPRTAYATAGIGVLVLVAIATLARGTAARAGRNAATSVEHV
jgi:MFS family permease